MIETGKTLKSTREGMGISLEEVSKDLEISVLALEQIEAGAVGAFDDIYELKKDMLEYAKYLGRDTEEVEKKFNEYMFDYTSKIPMEDIEKAIKENLKEEKEDEDRIASPYTMVYKKEKPLPYIIFGIIIVLLVIAAVVWSISQITGSSNSTDIVSYLG